MSDEASVLAAVKAYGLVSYQAGKRNTPDDGLPELRKIENEIRWAIAEAVVGALDGIDWDEPHDRRCSDRCYDLEPDTPANWCGECKAKHEWRAKLPARNTEEV